MKLAFVGRRGLGGVKMRGVAVADALGVPFLDLGDVKKSGRWDCLVLVKYWMNLGNAIRKACDRLVFDPLDCWMQTKPDAEPSDFWAWTFGELAFDDLLGTSPACIQMMESSQWHTWHARHHADHAITPEWREYCGPAVYAGGKQYIASGLKRVVTGLHPLPLRTDFSKSPQEALRGTSLVIHPRFPPTDTPLNRHCKPQVKAENAAAMGVPMLATPDPCVTSLYGTGRLHGPTGLHRFDMPAPYTLTQHVLRMREILGL